MDLDIIQSIFQDRNISYLTTDRHLRVVQVVDSHGFLTQAPSENPQSTLLDLLPELPGHEEVLQDLLAGTLPRYELPLVEREEVGGASRYLTIVILPLQEKPSPISGLLVILEDVTELGRVQQQLAQQRNELLLMRQQLEQRVQALEIANTELRRLDSVKSLFLSVAAHELRTPLTSIHGYLEMLLDGERGALTAPQEEYIEIAYQCGQRLLTITNNLLDVTRIETGRVELALKPHDLPQLVESVVTEFGPQLAAKSQRVVLRAPFDLPPALCDATRTSQVIGNLLSNANKYSSPGTQISIQIAYAEKEGFLQIAVEDHGPGIPVEDHAILFDCFTRAENGLAIDTSGIGLGLYITQSLVELHGGEIWFESRLGEGSTFYVTLPIAGPATIQPSDHDRGQMYTLFSPPNRKPFASSTRLANSPPLAPTGFQPTSGP